VEGPERNHSLFRLARSLTHIRSLNAVVGRVTNQVCQRIAEQLQHALVDLGIFAIHLQANLLAGGLRDVVDGTRVSLEERSYRQHANPHHTFMQLTGVAFHRCHSLAQLRQA
jgi:23S rRNA G2445 N2-methylase RlmL